MPPAPGLSPGGGEVKRAHPLPGPLPPAGEGMVNGKPPLIRPFGTPSPTDGRRKMLYHVRRSVRNDEGAPQNHMGWPLPRGTSASAVGSPMLQGQPRWFDIIFPSQAEIIPIGMCYIWEVDGDSSQIFKIAAITETPHRGQKAQRLTVVGPFSFPIESFRSHPRRRPPPASNPRTGRISSVCRAERGGGRIPFHLAFPVESAGGVSVPSERSTPVTLRFRGLQNEVHADTLFRIVNAPQPSPNRKGFFNPGFARTCLYICR